MYSFSTFDLAPGQIQISIALSSSLVLLEPWMRLPGWMTIGSDAQL